MDEPGTGRLETFSDGVFAIAATLLVLTFSVTSGKDLGHELLQLWPSYLAYVTSFLTIGIIWMNHHHTVSFIGRVDRTFLFVNNVLLLTVAFLPFPTGLVGEAIQQGAGEQAAALAYAGTLVVMAILHQIWWQYARRSRRLISDGTPDSALRAVDRAYWPGVPMYAAVFVVAFFSPLAAVAITFAIAAFYLPSAALFDR
ncbi:MAG TPA: TMEM175 family protein [Gaiellaceae bacterium]|nr:TMEM175 family protein [Gaiellaceae bacterium]